MGRKKTGLTRPIQIVIRFTAEEVEYIARAAYASKVSKSEFIRHWTIPPQFKMEIVRLKKEQGKALGIHKRR